MVVQAFTLQQPSRNVGADCGNVPRVIGLVGVAVRKQSLLILVLALVGCASTVQKSNESPAAPVGTTTGAGKALVLDVTGSAVSTSAKDWNDFRALWPEACSQEATAVGAAFSLPDAVGSSTKSDGTLVVVDVEDYRYVSTGARIAFGVMTGNAFINAKVTFRDLKSGEVRATKSYDTTSTAWQGVFSGMTTKQVRAMCHEIVGEVVR